MRRRMTAMLVLVMFLAVSGCDQISMANRSEGRVEAFQEDAPAIRIVVDNRDAPRGAGANRDPYLEYVEQNTRLKLKLITPNSGSYADFLNALMSSDDIPDLIHTDDPAWIAKYAEMGLLLPLDELLHNSVSGRKLLQLFPEEAWKASTFDGRIYAIPSLREVYGDEVMMARKDWLDALDLDPPETLEQYKRVMYAFTYGDPDRNLKNDTWGLTIMPGSLARTAPFFGAFGVPRGGNQIMQWKKQDDELVYSGILPETKRALEFLAELYAEGVLDREFILNKPASFYDKIINGQVGLFSAAWDDVIGPIAESMRRNPQAEWIRLPYPVGPDGQSGTANLNMVRSYTVIPRHSEHAREAISLLAFIAGDGHRTLKLGLTGEEERDSSVREVLYALADPNDPEVRKEWLERLGGDGQLNENVEYIMQHARRSDFQGPPTPSMVKFGAQLLKLENEMFAQIIMGMNPGQELFDKFSNEWIREGGWEIKHEVNKWYRDNREEGR